MVMGPVTVSVRRVKPADVGRLQAIQLAAGGAFRDLGMHAVADSPPLATESLSGYEQAGRAWVAADEYDEPMGFIVIDVVDDCAHIQQVSVHPAHSGQRIGALLIDHVASWAGRHCLAALTLITFRGVPWNAPYYERLGFSELRRSQLTPGLAALAAAEAEADQWHTSSDRVCMRRELAPPHTLQKPA